MTTRAQQYILQKSAMPTTARSRALQQLHPDITERAIFSAAVDKADACARIQDLTARMVNPDADGPGQKINKTVFREKMRQALSMMGHDINPDGDLTDITSTKRLNLIASMITQEAQGYGQFVQANDPAILSAFPAQELFRLQSKKVPRDWLAKWAAAGGKLYAGRMIAMKDDAIWTKRLESGGFNRFGRSWPPFDFNSGMWTKPVPRGEAVRLGVCGNPEVPKQQKRTYNGDLQQACKPLSEDLRNRLKDKYPGRFQIDESGVVHLLSVAEALTNALTEGRANRAMAIGKVNLGPVPAAVRGSTTLKLGSMDTIEVETSHLLHEDKHRSDLYPITDQDILAIPDLLNNAEASPVEGKKENRFVIRSGNKEIVLEKRKDRIAVITMYAYKKSG